MNRTENARDKLNDEIEADLQDAIVLAVLGELPADLAHIVRTHMNASSSYKWLAIRVRGRLQRHYTIRRKERRR